MPSRTNDDDLRRAMEREAKKRAARAWESVTRVEHVEWELVGMAEWMAGEAIRRNRQDAADRRAQASTITTELDQATELFEDDRDSDDGLDSRMEWKARHLRREAKVLDRAADSLEGALKKP